MFREIVFFRNRTWCVIDVRTECAVAAIAHFQADCCYQQRAYQINIVTIKMRCIVVQKSIKSTIQKLLIERIHSRVHWVMHFVGCSESFNEFIFFSLFTSYWDASFDYWVNCVGCCRSVIIQFTKWWLKLTLSISLSLVRSLCALHHSIQKWRTTEEWKTNSTFHTIERERERHIRSIFPVFKSTHIAKYRARLRFVCVLMNIYVVELMLNASCTQ